MWHSPPQTWIEPGSEVETADYIIFTDGKGNYYAKSGDNGSIVFSSTSASTVIQSAINSLTSGGKIFIKAGTYILTASVTIPLKESWSLLIEGEGPKETCFNVQGGGVPSISFLIDGSSLTNGQYTELILEHMSISAYVAIVTQNMNGKVFKGFFQDLRIDTSSYSYSKYAVNLLNFYGVMESVYVGNNNGCGMRLSYDTSWSDIFLHNILIMINGGGSQGIPLYLLAGSTNPTYLTIDNIHLNSLGGANTMYDTGMVIDSMTRVYISKAYIEGYANWAVVFNSTNGGAVYNYVELVSGGSVKFAGGPHGETQNTIVTYGPLTLATTGALNQNYFRYAYSGMQVHAGHGVAIGTNSIYGTPTYFSPVESDSDYLRTYPPQYPHIKLVVSNVGTSETIRMRVRTVYADGSTYTFTYDFTASGTYYLTDADINSLLGTNLLQKIIVDAYSTLSSTSASAIAYVYGS
jgi:hypothetical protein